MQVDQAPLPPTMQDLAPFFSIPSYHALNLTTALPTPYGEAFAFRTWMDDMECTIQPVASVEWRRLLAYSKGSKRTVKLCACILADVSNAEYWFRFAYFVKYHQTFLDVVANAICNGNKESRLIIASKVRFLTTILYEGMIGRSPFTRESAYNLLFMLMSHEETYRMVCERRFTDELLSKIRSFDETGKVTNDLQCYALTTLKALYVMDPRSCESLTRKLKLASYICSSKSDIEDNYLELKLSYPTSR